MPNVVLNGYMDLFNQTGAWLPNGANAIKLRGLDSPTSGHLAYSVIGANWSIDGGATRVAFNNLPAGLTPIAATDVSTNLFLSGATIPSAYNWAGTFQTLTFNQFTAGGTTPGILTLAQLNTFLQIDVNITFAGAILGQVDVNYTNGQTEIQTLCSYVAYSVTSITPSPLNTNTSPVTINLNGTNMDQFPTSGVSMHFTNAAGAQVVALPNAVLVSTVLATVTLGSTALTALRNFTGTITLFSGAVSLGTLTVYYATGSGIYKFVANQRHDILYDRSTGSTVSVAIPNPYGETGFIGG